MELEAFASLEDIFFLQFVKWRDDFDSRSEGLRCGAAHRFEERGGRIRKGVSGKRSDGKRWDLLKCAES